MSDYESRLLEVVRENMPEEAIPTAALSLDSHLIRDLGYDSIRLLYLIYALVQEFNADILNSSANVQFFSAETVFDILSLLEGFTEVS